ncbi:MAG TPA: nuclear transport factor 2 family protein [Steroidobacteraceae bacterium]|nr:nuclear transport factor 2 family protein [Steroidobacteraceae bacterium]
MITRRSTLAFALIAAATMMSDASFAKDDTRLAGLKAAEAARFKANVDADAQVLGQVLDDDLEYVHSNGEVNTKRQFIDSLTSGTRDYVATTFELKSVRILGDVAILVGTAKVTVADHGNSLDLDLGYTDIWVWKDRRWQMTAWRSARMPPASPAK